MKGFSTIFFSFSLFFLSFLGESKPAQKRNDGVYIVYMGAATSSPNSTIRDDHAQLLHSFSTRKQNVLVHTYRHGFSGFAARLTKEETDTIARRPGVISVFPDPVLQLHTTRSWDFLNSQSDLENDSTSNPESEYSSSRGSDTIIGILDTGIWPESKSFNDKGMGPIPSRWKGTCMEGENFSSSNCNRKIIGARYYNDHDELSAHPTPRDMVGHGTHVAATAAGSPVPGASYYGLATGTARGGSPGSRIAVYRVCSPTGCSGSNTLAAFDDAIADGVDVISLSLGSSAAFEQDFWSDPIAIGAFHAVEKGITVVCSAGNEGPTSETVVNTAPWIITVGAATIDRDFESAILLGENRLIKGEGIHFGNIRKSPEYPLIKDSLAKSSSNDVDEDEARNCNPGSLDDYKVKGKILLCENDDREYSGREKVDGVTGQGGIGVILIDDESKAVPSTYGTSPMSVITSKDASQLLSYIVSNGNPVATILPTTVAERYKPAPTVPYFSARGPSYDVKTLLKPDIVAPGVAILAAWFGNDTLEALPRKEPPLFNVLSGTSMSCPHVSGVAATVKSLHPSWSPAAIRSTIMTTATQMNNLKGLITTDSGSNALPYDYGAGLVSTTGPLQPGLIYETNTIDYIEFLCNYGYDITTIKIITSTVPDGYTCPHKPSTDFITNMNYPSIAISNFSKKKGQRVTRTVTNMGDEDETIYTATVATIEGLVKVTPDKLRFTENTKKLTYEIEFTSTYTTANVYLVSGWITWTNGKYSVQSPYVVSWN